MAAQIRTEVPVSAGGVTGPGRSTVLRLEWDETDPLCVRLTLASRPSHPSLPRGAWVASRELLEAGLVGPSGAGDVRVRPERTRGRVWFELQAPGRATSVAVPFEVLERMLAATAAIVPIDHDDPHDLVGAAVESFLAQLQR